MRSTTSRVLPFLGRQNGEADRQERNDSGLGVILELVRYGRLPRNVESESRAVTALEMIREGRCPTPGWKHQLDELRSEIDLARERRLQRLISRLELTRTPLSRKRSDRAILLFVLAAKLLTADRSSWVLRILNERGYFGRREASERLIRSVLPRLSTPGRLRLARRYLGLAARVARLDLGVGQDSVTVGEFRKWQWPRRLVHLMTRAELSKHLSDNLTYWSSSMEFQLARLGEFSRLRRQGGVIARRTLADLDYRDHPTARAGRIIRGICLLLLGGAAVMTFLSWQRFVAWDRSVSALTRSVLASTESEFVNGPNRGGE